MLEDDVRFFMGLLRMEFPLYCEDGSLNFAAFTVCQARNDDTFKSCLNALLSSNFDINRENDDNETFLQRICLSQFVSTARINAMLEH